MNYKNWYFVSGILGLSLVFSVVVFGLFYQNSKKGNDSISVTGSAVQLVTSDQAKLRISVMSKVYESSLSDGYKKVAKDISKITEFIQGKGFTETDYTVNPISLNEVWRGDYQSGEREYELRQEIIINSSRVSEVTSLSADLATLGEEGVFIQIFAVEYYYTGLPEARVQLLGQAMSDAKERASQLVEGAGSRLVGLKSASSGVVQVRQPNSVDVSDYGMYDTNSLEKEIMVTVRADFLLK